MDADKRAGGETNEEAVGRSRFRMSFTVSVLQLAVALAGVGVALLIARHGDGTPRAGQQLANATSPGSGTRSAEQTSTGRTPSGPLIVARRSDQSAPVDSGGSTTSSSVNGVDWPTGFAGYTVALASDVIKSNAVAAVAKARAAGLPQVGVLRSDRYASLRPGYWFVFSGVYGAADEARRVVAAAVDAGFSDAYVRRVAE
jgi:eukaryotic-like serine/threonine-protein kinase